MLFRSVKKIWETAFLKKTSPWQLAVWLGLLTSLFNFMIDFDWEFIGIASVTLLLLALLIGEESDSFNISEKLAKVFQPVFRLFYRFWLILLILVAGVYLTTEALIFAKQPSRAFQLFPYFYWQRSFYEAKADLSESEKQRLLSVYQNHPEIYLVYLIQTKDHEEIVRLKDRLYELDPWSWSLQDNIDIYLKSSQWEAAEQQLVRKYDFWQLAEERDGHEVSHANKAQLAEDALLLADGFYREGNPTKAAKYYQLAQTLDPWSLDSHQPVFTNLPLNYENQLIFFGKLARVEGEYLGQYRELYFDTYFASLSQAVAQGQLGDLETHAANLLSWSPWGGNQVWEQLGQALLNQASNYQRIGEYQAAQDRLQKAVALQIGRAHV